MKKQSVLLSKHCTVSMLCFLAAMLLIGSFFDESISRLVYNPANGFGIFFAAYGEFPVALGLVAAGALLWIARNKENKWIAVLQGLGGTWMIFSGLWMAILLPSLYLNQPFSLRLCIGVLGSAAVIFCMIKLCDTTDRKTILRVAAVIFFVILAEMLIVNFIKIPWGRARMRLVAVDARAYFMPWWQAGSEQKDLLVAAGVASEEFKSFPSGHTANAATLILLGLVPLLRQTLSDKKVWLVCLGFVWTCLVAFSRIIMGAHYLTDTVVGFAVSLAVMLVLSKIIFRNSSNSLSTAPFSAHNQK